MRYRKSKITAVFKQPEDFDILAIMQGVIAFILLLFMVIYLVPLFQAKTADIDAPLLQPILIIYVILLVVLQLMIDNLAKHPKNPLS